MSHRESQKRTFGLWSCVALVVANMIGSGVFTSSGFALAGLQNRNLVMWAWFVGGIIALLGAISYGALVQRITESGGEYLFLSRSVHPMAGFLAGWVSLIAGFTGAIAFAAHGFAAYAVPGRSEHEQALVGVGVVIVFAALHLVRKPGVVAQNAVVAVKLIVIGGFIIFAMTKFGNWPGHQVSDAPSEPFGLRSFATTVMWFSLAYSGFNAAVYITGEVDDPKRVVPRSMWIATAIVAVLYLLLNWIFVYGPKPEDMLGTKGFGEKEVAMIAAAAIDPGMLSWLLRLTVCLSLASSVSSMVIAGPRVYAKMADDGMFPALFRFQDENARGAILLQAALAAIVVWFSTLKGLLDYLSLTLSVSTALTVASLFISRKSEEPRPAVAYQMAAAAYVLFTLVFAAIHSTTTGVLPRVVAAAVTLVSGVAVYAILRKPGKPGRAR